MYIVISNQSKQPIYEQIKEQLKQHILTGELKEGEAIPSMRNLAKELHVSVITTKRAYEELEKEGLIYSMVGKGSFVAEQKIEIVRERKLRALEDQLAEVIQAAHQLGISKKELKQLIDVLEEE